LSPELAAVPMLRAQAAQCFRFPPEFQGDDRWFQE